jgi:hypothetical protein
LSLFLDLHARRRLGAHRAVQALHGNGFDQGMAAEAEQRITARTTLKEREGVFQR